MNLLDQARQIVALGKQIEVKLARAETIEPDDFDADDIEIADEALFIFGPTIAATLLEAYTHLLALANICEAHNIHVDVGADMNSKELAEMYKLKSASAFLAKMENDNG